MCNEYVKPGREEVARALALVGDYDGCFERLDAWAAASSEARECGDVEEPMSTDGEDAEWWLKRADAVLDLWPGRSEAEVDREALRRFVDSFCDDEAGEVEHVVSADGTSGFALTGGNDAHAVLRKAASALRLGESRATVQAGALRGAAGFFRDTLHDHGAAGVLDRLAAEGGADRG